MMPPFIAGRTKSGGHRGAVRAVPAPGEIIFDQVISITRFQPASMSRRRPSRRVTPLHTAGGGDLNRGPRCATGCVRATGKVRKIRFEFANELWPLCHSTHH